MTGICQGVRVVLRTPYMPSPFGHSIDSPATGDLFVEGESVGQGGRLLTVREVLTVRARQHQLSVLGRN